MTESKRGRNPSGVGSKTTKQLKGDEFSEKYQPSMFNERTPQSVKLKGKYVSKSEWNMMDEGLKDVVNKIDYQHQQELKKRKMRAGDTRINSGIFDSGVVYRGSIPDDAKARFRKRFGREIGIGGDDYYGGKPVRLDLSLAHRSGSGADLALLDSKGRKMSKAYHQEVIYKVIGHLRKNPKYNKNKAGENKISAYVHGRSANLHGHISTVGMLSKSEAEVRARSKFGFTVASRKQRQKEMEMVKDYRRKQANKIKRSKTRGRNPSGIGSPEYEESIFK